MDDSAAVTQESADPTLSVFRSVCALPSRTFEDIMCRHYGTDALPTALATRRKESALLTEGYNNLSVYLNVTHRLGRREEVMNEIRVAYKALFSGGNAKIAADSPHAGNGEMEAAEALLELEYAKHYLDAVECNTTRSCCLEIGAPHSDPCWFRDSSDEEDDDAREEEPLFYQGTSREPWLGNRQDGGGEQRSHFETENSETDDAGGRREHEPLQGREGMDEGMNEWKGEGESMSARQEVISAAPSHTVIEIERLHGEKMDDCLELVILEHGVTSFPEAIVEV